MQCRTTAIIAAVFALMLIHTAYAAFPYSAPWLNYADKRLVYQIDTSGITSNDPNTYVTISIDPTTLQDYIDRWSDYCDPVGRYDWFWPTFTYASTANNNERMLQVVEYNSFQTFTIGTCGTASLPTQFTLLLPNGVLDGGDSYATYDHYVYAYLKYPYVDDFYDNPVGFPVEEYTGDLVDVVFDSGFEKGHFVSPNNKNIYRDVDWSIDMSGHDILCFHIPSSYSDRGMYVFVYESANPDVNEWVYVGRGRMCADLSKVLAGAGFSNPVVGQIKITTHYYWGWDALPHAYWWWYIPSALYHQIAYGS